jgi:hypothetical protein
LLKSLDTLNERMTLMTLLKKMSGLGIALAAAALLFSSLATTVTAQTPPFVAYGTGATSGDAIVVLVGGASAGTATADADGNWGPVNVDGASGDAITFTVNGTDAEQSATWSSGGTPSDVAAGFVLTVAGSASSAAPAAPAAPAPSDTGNAGLVATGSSSALMLLMVAFAASMVAGARFATRIR